MFVFHNNELAPIGYIDLDFQCDKDSHRSTYSFAFTLISVTISWKSVKQSCIYNSFMEVEYVSASKRSHLA